MPIKLCLNGIVKNESARIERMLASVAQFIDGYVITDTGSTDDTVEKIEKFFKMHHVPGRITHAPFENWSQARNAALVEGHAYCLENKLDYLIMVDADMELVVKDVGQFLSHKTGLSYDMYQRAGSLHYLNRRLVHAAAPGGYRGVTHEYVDIETAGTISDKVAYFNDHADGANRPDKFKRDIQLLRDDLKKDPTNGRSMFYLANSYRDAGQSEKAAKWYQRRVAAGGWDEEVWNAQGNYAACLKDMGREADFLKETLVAYHMRPTRAEPLYDLARHYREKGMNAPALAFAEAGVKLPPSNDSLFVNTYVSDVGLQEEISITAFYVPGQRERGYKVTSDLSLKAGPYGGARELARNNLYHYIQPIKEFCPSFKWRTIPFVPAKDWVAMNPSVTLHRDQLYCNVRTVNYRIDPEGRYIINASDGTANAENPIFTRNFILRMGYDPFTDTNPAIGEVFHPDGMPVEFPLVIGFEDMRLFSWKDHLHSSSTVRQIHWDGNCEQVLTRLGSIADFKFQHRDMRRMLRQPRATEKNWAPMLYGRHDSRLSFMWRPGEVVDTDGNTIFKQDTGMATDHISGSSQLIPWGSGYLAIVHEARQKPGSPLRYYYHRFAQYDYTGALKSFSLPFVFHDREIEFCAGMCAHPVRSDKVVISYGYKDCEARIATVDTDDVENFLCQSKS